MNSVEQRQKALLDIEYQARRMRAETLRAGIAAVGRAVGRLFGRRSATATALQA